MRIVFDERGLDVGCVLCFCHRPVAEQTHFFRLCFFFAQFFAFPSPTDKFHECAEFSDGYLELALMLMRCLAVIVPLASHFRGFPFPSEHKHPPQFASNSFRWGRSTLAYIYYTCKARVGFTQPYQHQNIFLPFIIIIKRDIISSSSGDVVVDIVAVAMLARQRRVAFTE